MGDNLTAVDLGTDFEVQFMALGLWHSCVVSTSASMKCMGYNSFGFVFFSPILVDGYCTGFWTNYCGFNLFRNLGYEDMEDRGDDSGEMGDYLDFVDLGTGFLVEMIALSAPGANYQCVAESASEWKCFGFVLLLTKT